MRNASNETAPITLSWTKGAADGWIAEHRGYRLNVREEKLPQHPLAFIIYVDGVRMGSRPTLDAAKSHAATLID